MTEKDKQFCEKVQKAICDNSSEDAQLLMCIEECSELIQAISKYQRRKNDEELVKAAKDNVIEEIADVQNTIDEVMYLLNISHDEINAGKKSKLERQCVRMGIKIAY